MSKRMVTGKVTITSRGYGYIEVKDEQDIYLQKIKQ